MRQSDPSNDATGDSKRMSREAALRKIKTCAGIAKSNNPHGAVHALQQMQALMAEFNIDDLELADIVYTDTTRARGGKGAPPWLLTLAALVGRAFHTESLQSSGRSSHYFQFVGESGACEISVHAYSVLLRQLNAARKHYLKRVRVARNRVPRGDQFAFGWIASVTEMLGGNVPMSTELAIKIKAKMAVLHPELKSVQVAARDTQLASKRMDDFSLGRAAGRDAKLHTPVRAAPLHSESIGWSCSHDTIRTRGNATHALECVRAAFGEPAG